MTHDIPNPKPEGETVTDDGVGWVSFNPDAGEEYSPNHPVESGECVEATNIRRSTRQEDVLWAGMQAQFQRAEALAASPKPTTVEASGVVERFINPHAERLGDDIYVWFDAPDDAIQPFILDEDYARAFVAAVSAALSASSPSSEQGRG